MGKHPSDWLRSIDRAIWTTPTTSLPAWRKAGLRGVRLVMVLFRDLVGGQLTLWSMSLVYTTLLSMVPLLALSFSVLKGFGVHNQVEPLLANVLAPLGSQGTEITARLVDFIERMNVGVLGAVGLALLIYTVISLMQKIEASFNAIWHVSAQRSMSERFSRYLSALLVGPMLVFAALGLTAMATSSDVVRAILAIEPVGTVLFALGRLVPYVLIVAAFTFLYVLIPNTRVRLVPAVVAGIVGGVLWQTAGWAFATFIASSTRYAAIYSSFAILVLFLIWLYLSWLVLLVGVSVSFYLQHPEYLYVRSGEPRLSNRMRERVGLAVMGLVATRFMHGQKPWSRHELAGALGIPVHAVDVVLDAFAQAGLIAQTADEPPAYLPARDLGQVSIAATLDVIRTAGEDRFLGPDALPYLPHVESHAERIARAVAVALADASVLSLVSETTARRAGADEGTEEGTPRDRAA